MSLATVEQYMDAKIVVASLNDGLYTSEQIQRFLDYATDFIESQCYQNLELTAHSEVLEVGTLYCSVDTRRQLNIVVKNSPVVAISAVSYKRFPADDWTLIDSDTWSFTISSSRINVPYASPLAPGLWGLVKVDYSAGYVAGSVPGDLVFATILIAAHFASMGYAAIDIRSGMVRQVLPRDAMRIVDDTISRYQRQF